MRANSKFTSIITSSLLFIGFNISIANAEDTVQAVAPVAAADARSIVDKGFFLQVGAFESEENSNQLSHKLNGFERKKSVELFKLYNDGVYQVKLGPYETRKAADLAIQQIRKQYKINAIIKNHF
jgi:rare lipoprotein A